MATSMRAMAGAGRYGQQTRSASLALSVAVLGVWLTAIGRAQDGPSREEAAQALDRAVRFFCDQVSVQGGYLWRYSEDLALREGEEKATASMAWIQPPGTPAVGEAYLLAYERVKAPSLREAAIQTARALVRGQLHSGGWDNAIEFDPARRPAYAYRVDGPPRPRARNVSTLDDDKTQSCIRFLMHVDRLLEFQDAEIHEATRYALDQLVQAQYPNGAWPQRFSGPPRAEEHPVLPARYPDQWPREFPGTNYAGYYTLNDNTLADVIRTLLEAAEIYGERRYFEAARRGGDFLLLAQMPDPQPAWAQQYNAQMEPAWARKFEPPAITGGESQGAIRILLEVYRHTGDRKYLAPIPRALDYLEKSQLPGGRLARFYELKTNRPLYFTKDYKLVYTDDDLPTHYAFVVSSNVAALRKAYEELAAAPAEQLRRPSAPERITWTPRLAAEARRVIDALDERGAWVEDGRLSQADDGRGVQRIITTRTFIRNLDILSRFLAASAR
jgi:PelA/Pel-15E family pectate lyase